MTPKGGHRKRLLALFLLSVAAPLWADWPDLPLELRQATATARSRALISSEALALDLFAIEWDGEAIEGVSWKFESTQLEWVRVAPGLALPRAMVEISASNAESGSVRLGTLNFPMLIKGAGRVATFP